jgi:hypothetical protein
VLDVYFCKIQLPQKLAKKDLNQHEWPKTLISEHLVVENPCGENIEFSCVHYVVSQNKHAGFFFLRDILRDIDILKFSGLESWPIFRAGTDKRFFYLDFHLGVNEAV